MKLASSTRPSLDHIALRALATLLLLVAAGIVQADILTVGKGQRYANPSQAAQVARTGDTVEIQPGLYRSCAVWRADRLTIEGTGPGVILANKTCLGQAIFVISGNDVTVRNITFRGARVADANGAGIRAAGTNLTIDNDRFIDNQEGILSGSNPASTILIRDSLFERNGACIKQCAHGVYVGHIALLKIEHSRFYETLIAHHIKSRAEKTVLIDNRIEDGPRGTASYEVDVPNGGTLIMIGNTLEKGPRNHNATAAIMIGEEGVTHPTPEILIKDNRFTNDGPPTTFVYNRTSTPARLIGNTLKGHRIRPLAGKGSIR